MTAELEKLIQGKPDCFAVPQEFHPWFPRCERCPEIASCAGVADQVASYLESNSISMDENVLSVIRPFRLRKALEDYGGSLRPAGLTSSVLDPLLRRALAYLEPESTITTWPTTSGFASHQELKELIAELDDAEEQNLKAAAQVVPLAQQPRRDVPVVQRATTTSPPALRRSVHDQEIGELLADRDDTEEQIPKGAAQAVPHAQQPPPEVPTLAPSTAGRPEEMVEDDDFAPAPPTSSYGFPMPKNREFTALSNADLVERLQRLVRQTDVDGYGTVREELCALHIEMNLRREHAPRFRPMTPLPKECHTPDEINMALDRQVLDLHWRAFADDKPICTVSEYPTIFDLRTF